MWRAMWVGVLIVGGCSGETKDDDGKEENTTEETQNTTPPGPTTDVDAISAFNSCNAVLEGCTEETRVSHQVGVDPNTPESRVSYGDCGEMLSFGLQVGPMTILNNYTYDGEYRHIHDEYLMNGQMIQYTEYEYPSAQEMISSQYSADGTLGLTMMMTFEGGLAVFIEAAYNSTASSSYYSGAEYSQELTYDSQGRLIHSVTVQGGQTYTIDYDLVDFDDGGWSSTSVVLAGGGNENTEVEEYDADGLLVSRSSTPVGEPVENGTVSTFEYDSMGRRVEEYSESPQQYTHKQTVYTCP